MDPSRVFLGDHFTFNSDGTVAGVTEEGWEFIFLLRLEETLALNVRQEKLTILQLKRRYPDDPEVHQVFLQTFGYPEDLPDLNAKRPLSNSRQNGINESHFVRRLEGRLPPVY